MKCWLFINVAEVQFQELLKENRTDEYYCQELATFIHLWNVLEVCLMALLA